MSGRMSGRMSDKKPAVIHLTSNISSIARFIGNTDCKIHTFIQIHFVFGSLQ